MPELTKKPKKVPMRMCVACQAMKPKKELARVVASSDGAVSLDPSGRAAGRGAYLCRSTACLAKAVKEKRLERALKTMIPREMVERLAKELSGGLDGS